MAFVWELTKDTIHLPLGCPQGGLLFLIPDPRPPRALLIGRYVEVVARNLEVDRLWTPGWRLLLPSEEGAT